MSYRGGSSAVISRVMVNEVIVVIEIILFCRHRDISAPMVRLNPMPVKKAAYGKQVRERTGRKIKTEFCICEEVKSWSSYVPLKICEGPSSRLGHIDEIAPVD